MSPRLRVKYAAELASALAAEHEAKLPEAWRHLERAHILSQAYAWPHTVVHARMLGFGWRRRNAREIVGQLVRLVVAAPGSLLGRAPLGNTGGANVGILTPMTIPEDLRAILEDGYRQKSNGSSPTS